LENIQSYFGEEAKMKKYFPVLQLIFGVLFFSSEIFSQIDVQNYISKSRADLIKSLGKPAHIDDSNSSMVMIFYKTAESCKSFVADENGIFQAEALQSYDSEKNCRASLNGYLGDMVSKGFKVDTLSTDHFQSEKPGVTCTVSCGLNSLTKKYEISVSAHRKES
jgi:hypothetical protein